MSLLFPHILLSNCFNKYKNRNNQELNSRPNTLTSSVNKIRLVLSEFKKSRKDSISFVPTPTCTSCKQTNEIFFHEDLDFTSERYQDAINRCFSCRKETLVKDLLEQTIKAQKNYWG